MDEQTRVECLRLAHINSGGYLGPKEVIRRAEIFCAFAMGMSGFIVVPREPTEAMLEAGDIANNPDYDGPSREETVKVWRAMVEAALADKS